MATKNIVVKYALGETTPSAVHTTGLTLNSTGADVSNADLVTHVLLALQVATTANSTSPVTSTNYTFTADSDAQAGVQPAAQPFLYIERTGTQAIIRPIESADTTSGTVTTDKAAMRKLIVKKVTTLPADAVDFFTILQSNLTTTNAALEAKGYTLATVAGDSLEISSPSVLKPATTTPTDQTGGTDTGTGTGTDTGTGTGTDTQNPPDVTPPAV